MTEKVKIEVAPNLKMDIEVTADNITDIHVAAMEEELERLEKALTAELKDDEEAQKATAKKLHDAVDAFGETFTENLEKNLLPTMRKFGFKGLTTRFVATSLSEDKIALSLIIDVDTKKPRGCAGELSTSHAVALTPELKALQAADKRAREKVQKTTDKLVQVKEALGNVAKLERKARAEMARNLLQTTDSGRQLLNMLQTRKALPLKD